MPDFFREAKLFAFDLDGTLYLGEEAVPGAVELVARLRQNHQIAYFTNNSSKTAAEVHEKLERLGFDVRPGEVYTSSAAAARHLGETGVDDLFVVGTDSLRRELELVGLRLVEAGQASNLVVGLDRDFSYRKIAAALTVLMRGGRFVACNEDARFPVENGVYLPGCGAMVGAIAAAAGRRPDFVVGKPNDYMLALLAGARGVEAREIIVVGDSFESDIAMARRYGCRAVLIGRARADAGRDVLVVDDLRGLQDAIGAGWRGRAAAAAGSR
jgi:HAD superfamily hydrolase (TIGR01450 family)